MLRRLLIEILKLVNAKDLLKRVVLVEGVVIHLKLVRKVVLIGLDCRYLFFNVTYLAFIQRFGAKWGVIDASKEGRNSIKLRLLRQLGHSFAFVTSFTLLLCLGFIVND